MKKLTKVLSLVLVIAMIVSLCVVGVSAKTFTDGDKVTADYKEAVDVVSDLGIVTGTSATSSVFNAAGNFTRAEACVMLAKATLGDKAAIIAPTTVTFKDVPTSFWGYKYIEYCANAGLVAGTGNGNFSPAATLTGIQYAKMLMSAIGVDTSSIKGGANWAIDTAKLYFKADFSDVAATNAVITREAAAQMTYDALFYGPDAKTGYAVIKTVGDVQTVAGVYDTVAEAVAMQGVLAAKNEANTTYTVSTDKYTLTDKSLAVTVFGMFCVPGHDYFGRPANVYTTLKKAQATAYGWDADHYDTLAKQFVKAPVLTYTSAVTGGKLYTDLGKVTPTTLAVEVNGYSADAYTAGVKANLVSGNTNSYGGNGTTIEVYKNATGDYTIVASSVMPGYISDHSDAVKDANGDITTKENVTITYAGGTATFDTTAFTAADVKAKTVVIATYTTEDNVKYTVRSLKAATPASVTATAVVGDPTRNINKSAFVADGKTYQYNENCSSFVNGTDVANKTAKAVFLDDNGYVVAVADPTTTASVAVVLGAVNVPSLDGTTNSARLLMNDGTTKDVVASADASGKVDDIVTYIVNAKGQYVLTSVAADGANAASITQGTVSFTAAGDTYKANANTLFFVETTDTATGKPVYNVYKGISAVPTLTATTSAVYTVADATYATAVYVKGVTLASASTAAKDIIYITTKGAYPTTVSTGTFYTCNAVVNGKVETVKIADTAIESISDGIYVATVKDANGIITSAVKMTNDAATKVAYTNTATGTTAAADGVVKFASDELTYTEATTVYMVAADGTITAVAAGIAGVKTDANDAVCYYTTNGVLTSAFITVDGAAVA